MAISVVVVVETMVPCQTIPDAGGAAATCRLEKSHRLHPARGACTHVGPHGNERLTLWGMYMLSHYPGKVVRVMTNLPAIIVVSRQTQ